MPTFEIPDGPTTVDLKRSPDGSATGSVAFNVTNKSTDSISGRLSVVPSGGSQEGWFAIDGDRERTFAAGETQTAKITVTAPKTVAAGDYPFKLRAVAVNDPDNDHTEGPMATAKVPAPPVPGPKPKWWLWILIGLVVLAVLGVGGYFLAEVLSGPDDNGNTVDNTTNTQTPGPKKVPKYKDRNVDTIAADADGYKIIKNETPNTNRQPRIVYEQDPAPDQELKAGKQVILSYEPGVDVPQVANRGMNLLGAINQLSNAKLVVGSITPVCQNTGMAGEVISQSISPPAKAAMGGNINLSVRALNGEYDGQKVICFKVFPIDKFLQIRGTVSPVTARVLERNSAIARITR